MPIADFFISFFAFAPDRYIATKCTLHLQSTQIHQFIHSRESERCVRRSVKKSTLYTIIVDTYIFYIEYMRCITMHFVHHI